MTMAGRIRHLLTRQGRHYARVVVPPHLREILKKGEFQCALGGDLKVAQMRLHGVVARFQAEIAHAEREYILRGGRVTRAIEKRFTAAEIAQTFYREELSIDDSGRNHPDLRTDMSAFRPAFKLALQRVAAGSTSLDEAGAIIGWAVDEFARREGRTLERESGEWFALARQLAQVQLETLKRQDERDSGDFSGVPALQILREHLPDPVPAHQPVLLDALVELYSRDLAAAGRGEKAMRRWRPVFADLKVHLRHGDAARISQQDLQQWRSKLADRLSPKTISGVHLAAVKALFGWANDMGHLSENPAKGLKIRVPKAQFTRERGFTQDEAEAVLTATIQHQPRHSSNPATRESIELTSAKRWVPLLCAYSGARVAEIAQLRCEDVCERDGIRFIRLTPEAGSIKSGNYRDVPIHPHVVELGFLQFVETVKVGPLFYRVGTRKGATHPADFTARALATWLRGLDCMPADVPPNHAWRHRFKTVALELQLNQRVCDAIQGHAARTAGEAYGNVTLRARNDFIQALPKYNLRLKS